MFRAGASRPPSCTMGGADRVVSLPFIWLAASSNARLMGEEDIVVSRRGGELATCVTIGLGALMLMFPPLGYTAAADGLVESEPDGSEELDFFEKSR